MNRTTTWENIGTSVHGASTIQEVLEGAKLNYNVVKAPIFLEDGYMIPDKVATKIEGTNDIFGIVGKDYTIVQNEEAFDFVNGIIPEGLEFVKAGTVWGGSTVYIIGKLPSQYILGDEVTPYAIFQNNHNGGGQVRATICPLRIICQNQFNMSFRHANNAISIRHTTNAHHRMTEAQSVLAQNALYMNTFKANAEVMAKTKLTKSQVTSIVEQAFPIGAVATTRMENSMVEKRQRLMTAYNEADNQNFTGTVYGLVNAFTDYATHKELERKTEDGEANRFAYTVFDTRILDSFVELVMAKVK